MTNRVRPDRQSQLQGMASLFADFRKTLPGRGTPATSIRPGIAQAGDHAERDCPGWNADALAFLRAYAATHGEFIAEAVVAAHKAAGHPEPPTTRAWGGVVQGAAHRGEIVEVGFAQRSNGSPCKVWKKNGTA